MKRSGELKRSTPLKRSPFKRAEGKPEPKRRQRKCVVCRSFFEPRSMTHKACGPECAATHVELERARKERRERQEGLAKLKRRADYLREAQAAFNAFIRERDKDKPCICCGRSSTGVSGLHSHAWDCGHYRSTGSAPHLRFDERNAHRQKVLCNRYGAGRAVDYRIGLIARIGLAAVEELEADNTPRKWDVEELKFIKATYQQKLRELRNANR